MVDVLTKEQRKHNMSRIRGKNTTPEIKFRKLLYARGFRGYRIHPDLPGKPDIAFTRQKIAIFIDGCFWHKCPIDFKEPDTRKDFWLKKINSNVERDRKTDFELKSLGWTVFRVWEHEIRKDPAAAVQRLTAFFADD
jgi:DNA mismatch endonuclease, patch repair protein